MPIFLTCVVPQRAVLLNKLNEVTEASQLQ